MLVNITFQVLDASPLINYSSGWLVGGDPKLDPSAPQYDGSFTPTPNSGAQATINFVGNSVSLFGSDSSLHSVKLFEFNQFKLDQNALFTASGFAQVNTFQKPLFVASGLEYTSHQLTITNVPVSTNDTWLDLDFVTVERQIGDPSEQAFQVTLDDSDASSSIIYTPGSWSPISATSAFQATLHQTTVAQAQVTILFQGCCIELYGHYANAQYTVTLDNKAPVPFQGLDFDLTPQQQRPQTLLYLMDGLSEDSHNVTLTNINANSNRPFFFDFARVRSTKNFSNTTGPVTGGGGNTTTTPSTMGKAATPIAPIVGGIVGGLLVLAILATVAFFVVRRRRRRPADISRPESPSEYLPQPYFVTTQVPMNGGEEHMQYPPSHPGAHTQDMTSLPQGLSATQFVPDRKRLPLPLSSTASASDLAGSRTHHTTVIPEDGLQTAALGVNVAGSHTHTLSNTSQSTTILSHTTGQSGRSTTVSSSPAIPPPRDRTPSLPHSENGDSFSRMVVQPAMRTIPEADAGVTPYVIKVRESADHDSGYLKFYAEVFPAFPRCRGAWMDLGRMQG
ncbi:hypothetical protein BU17DRAFT_60225 [Hysterangium stoloniferum]|nr:hypothetical protein BU17DRAFT_60225 [Hysterangium stoloniferum]